MQRVGKRDARPTSAASERRRQNSASARMSDCFAHLTDVPARDHDTKKLTGELNFRVTRWLNKVLTVNSTVSVSSPALGIAPGAAPSCSVGRCSLDPRPADRRGGCYRLGHQSDESGPPERADAPTKGRIFTSPSEGHEAGTTGAPTKGCIFTLPSEGREGGTTGAPTKGRHLC
eukprot:1180098-Prorocentrum_minimum.AAC.1